MTRIKGMDIALRWEVQILEVIIKIVKRKLRMEFSISWNTKVLG